MNSQDKSNLIKRITEIEGLTDAERSSLLCLLRENKTYGLVWEDKPEAIEEKLRDELPILTEVPEKAIISEAKDAPNHILIEGDNLEALSTLAYTHAGKIDVIYIDPPYNTGNKDFIYNDKFVDTEDSYRHSKWLSFMSRRLKIAKQLLSDKGIIFISIDDNEQANLKLLCDEVFGEINGIGPIIQNKLNAKNDTINIQKNHEFILCYRKKIIFTDSDKAKIEPNLNIVSEDKREVFLEDGRYYYINDSITTRGEGGTLNSRPNLGYTFYYNPKSKDLIPVIDYDIEKAKYSNLVSEIYKDDTSLTTKGYIPIRAPKVRGKLGCWTWEHKKSVQEKRNLIVKKGTTRYNVIKRTFVPNCDVVESDKKYLYTTKLCSNSKSILEFSTNAGSTTLSNIITSEKFNNPKNPDLIKYLINAIAIKNITILDFFAGSGTTLHATMQLNAEDQGTRQCILVTNNENNICENVTYKRNKRVINGYTTPKGVEVAGLKKNNLRYYRTGFVGRSRSVQNMRKLVNLATDMLCIKENLYAEQAAFGEIATHKNVFRYFEDGNKKMLVIYREEAIPELVEAICDIESEETIKVYVFSPSEDPWEGEFEDVSDKVELCALPHAINDAYCRILQKP